jgi:hypothetical protein
VGCPVSDPIEGAVAAYWRFFEVFNSRDSRQFGSALNYPHIRVSARAPSSILADADAHAESMNYEQILRSGWDHSVGMEPEIVHVTSHKVHIKGGWTRYTKDVKPIFTNHVTYVMTLVDDHWGMQARFGIDGSEDSEGNAEQAIAVVQTAFESMGIDNAFSAHLFHLPHFVINPGDVETAQNEAELEHNLPGSALLVTNVEVLQVGSTGVNVALNATFGERLVEGVVLVVLEDGRWGIKSRSLMIS